MAMWNVYVFLFPNKAFPPHNTSSSGPIIDYIENEVVLKFQCEKLFSFVARNLFMSHQNMYSY